ncbi:hypothetical protein CEV33_2140 [Brucella grignonensis]|uniref:Uncharacterized protein n=1 Tax=Brucella grignonensis TaxID=94627 RepID=A0A256F737_9HYPH|nr:hypothetical protein CEV33_2140 [Brucella grignonensis]
MDSLRRIILTNYIQIIGIAKLAHLIWNSESFALSLDRLAVPAYA